MLVQNTLIQGQHEFFKLKPKDIFNGHAYVDLGLPSGTLWSLENMPSLSYYGVQLPEYIEYYDPSSYEQYMESDDPLPLSADIAAQLWGGNWHIPTKALFEELIANTTYTWVTHYNGSNRNGGLFTALNGNSVFFVANGKEEINGPVYDEDISGYYWSSTPEIPDEYNYEHYAYNLYFNANGVNINKTERNYLLYSVHPVMNITI